jgi:hypothetical protein
LRPTPDPFQELKGCDQKNVEHVSFSTLMEVDVAPFFPLLALTSKSSRIGHERGPLECRLGQRDHATDVDRVLKKTRFAEGHP